MKYIRRLYIANRFFYILLLLAACFALSFYIEPLRIISTILLWVWVAVCIWDLTILHLPKHQIIIQRKYPDKLSNGDENPFSIGLTSTFPFRVNARVLEEIPVELQQRNNEFNLELIPRKQHLVEYKLQPKKRGVYVFGKCNVLVSHLGLFERKFVLDDNLEIPCYPSFIQMRKYQLLATTDRLVEMGVKRIRKIGSTMEFDHIREYVKGDEYKKMNWKASAKHKRLMVNQYQEEKSQPIYSFIDIGRVMRMPFNEMTLLDYAINSTLVLSNAAVLKQDRAGMLTFGKKIDNHIIPEKNNKQMKLISDKLYGINTNFEESEFGNLYAFMRRHINKRSLIFLYSNFETLDSLNRQLSYLRMMAKSHIIVVVVFKNTELIQMAREEANSSIEIYNKIIAEKFVYEKGLIIQELNRNGLQTIYTAPEDLSIKSINKYLEIKARGLI
ncbi:DUF58 domain-containing protein [Sphingobacterium bovistauri]|uniref:DUF58 domain-containing protein n=1 Tax=Sphingobacterium bovistauri TaxID=2781959 RepID=A0ABS7ZAZ3_9SPHI|nr:DUF58 domain-containing protein [Sphingobacterium bovistauri]MCA5005864.1 DUF58 domain-containing protein [Sphingobacterium bovistauri]